MGDYKRDVRFGPTYRFVCNDCGHRVERWGKSTTGTEQWYCDHCEEVWTLRGRGSYKVEKVKVADDSPANA